MHLTVEEMHCIFSSELSEIGEGGARLKPSRIIQTKRNNFVAVIFFPKLQMNIIWSVSELTARLL